MSLKINERSNEVLSLKRQLECMKEIYEGGNQSPELEHRFKPRTSTSPLWWSDGGGMKTKHMHFESVRQLPTSSTPSFHHIKN